LGSTLALEVKMVGGLSLNFCRPWKQIKLGSDRNECPQSKHKELVGAGNKLQILQCWIDALMAIANPLGMVIHRTIDCMGITSDEELGLMWSVSLCTVHKQN
jgi:hypothetical protein